MPDIQKNDEIDLVHLFLGLVRGFRANFLLIVIFFVVGSSLGVVYFFSSKKIFENKMIVSSGILTESYAKILFDNINRHLGEGNTKLLADQFAVPETVMQGVSSLRIETLRKDDPSDHSERDRFLITVDVSDQKILPDLQRGLISYLENNDYAKIRVEQNRRTYSQMRATIDKEIKDMEELKAKIFSGEFSQNSKGNVMFDPTTLNSKIVELTEKKLTHENNLQLSSSVQIIEGFSQFQKQSRPKLSISVFAGSMVGLFFVGALIAFKSIRKLLELAEAAK